MFPGRIGGVPMPGGAGPVDTGGFAVVGGVVVPGVPVCPPFCPGSPIGDGFDTGTVFGGGAVVPGADARVPVGGGVTDGGTGVVAAVVPFEPCGKFGLRRE
jgi:hypothetical protein